MGGEVEEKSFREKRKKVCKLRKKKGLLAKQFRGN